VAEAEFDLARVRRAKVALIDRMMGLGTLEAPEFFKSIGEELGFFDARPRAKIRRTRPQPPMPLDEPDQSAKAFRRALQQLLRFDRYERNARARRDRAVAEMITCGYAVVTSTPPSEIAT